jgi:hypothetical protein
MYSTDGLQENFCVNILSFAYALGTFLCMVFTLVNEYLIMKEKVLRKVVKNLLHLRGKCKG